MAGAGAARGGHAKGHGGAASRVPLREVGRRVERAVEGERDRLQEDRERLQARVNTLEHCTKE